MSKGEQQSLTSLPAAEIVPAGPADTSPGAILRLAVERGMDVAGLEKLVALHERMADRRAAAEFAEAMSRFQAKCKSIPRASKAHITTKSGSRYQYNYAELDAIVKAISEDLHAEGLSFSWDSKIEGETLHCTCTLRHVNGHSTTASFTAPTETRAGMSEQQKYGAALSYARRQSLIQVLGLTTCDPDTDAAPVGSGETITEQQLWDLQALIEEVKADHGKFCKYMGVSTLQDIRATEFTRAVKALESKRR